MPKQTKSTKKTKKSEQNKADQPSQFIDLVKSTLDNFRDVVWLGEHSPLATPYFLGVYLVEDGSDGARQRGEALQRLLRESTRNFAEPYHHFKHLIETTYFGQKKSIKAIQIELDLPNQTYYRHRDLAIEYLASEILRHLRPGLRLEIPPWAGWLIGRDETLDEVAQALEKRQTVAVTGPGGIGKTVLGVVLARRLAANATFWFTIRPGLNDQLFSLMFVLAYFLFRQGVPQLWQQLLANLTKVDDPKQQTFDTEVALSILRYDLAKLTKPFILCIDEVDLLRPEEIEAHGQLIIFLESLRSLAPVILIGQKRSIEADMYLELKGLDTDQTEQMLRQQDVVLSKPDIVRLHTYTGGTPRLIELFGVYYQALERTGEPPETALDELASQPTLEATLKRIWRHLTEDEQYLLQILAVFRRPIPKIALFDEVDAISVNQLVTWDLIQAGDQDDITLLPAYKETIYNQLLEIEIKENLHIKAAEVRTRYGQHTAAGYHYLSGGEAHRAVWLIHRYKDVEVNQGQAATILSMLQMISKNQLPSQKDKEALELLRAEIEKLLGDYDTAHNRVQRTIWRTPFFKAKAKLLEGEIAQLRDQYRRAIDAYQSGLEAVDTLIGQRVEFLRNAGYTFMNNKDFALGYDQILQIRYEAENLEGYYELKTGNVKKAQAYYDKAIDLAERINYAYGVANTSMMLGNALAWADGEAAEPYLQRAIQFFKQTNRLNKLASATINLSVARFLAGKYQDAIAPAEEALSMFNQLREPFGSASAMQMLSETYLALDDLEKAEGYTRQVIQTEDVSTLPDALRTLGEILLKQGNLRESEQYIQQSIALSEETQNKILEGYGWRAFMTLSLAKGDEDKAKEAKAKALTIFEEIGMAMEVEKTELAWQNGI